MEESINKNVIDKKIWLNSFKMFSKILICVVFVFFFVLASLFVLSPKIDAKIFEFFGFKKAQEASLIQTYQKSEDIVDLYNLVLLEQQLGNSEKELYYINVLMAKKEYYEFCKKLDKSSIQNQEKSMYAYIGNVDGYLRNRKVKCLYAINMKQSYENRSNAPLLQVRNELKYANMYESTFATFVNLVLSDETLTNVQKQETFQTLKDVYTTEDVVLTGEYLTVREENLLSSIEMEQDNVKKIIQQKVLLDFLKAEYRYYEVLGESDSFLNVIKQKYEKAVEDYNNLIK